MTISPGAEDSLGVETHGVETHATREFLKKGEMKTKAEGDGRVSGNVKVTLCCRRRTCRAFYYPCSSVWLHTEMQRCTLVYATSILNIVQIIT